MKKLGGLTTLLLVVLAATGCGSKPEAKPVQFTPTAEPVASVDSATVSKVKQACEDQLKAIAVSSGKSIAGVPPKPYSVVSVTFTSEVKEVHLPYDRKAWEVPLEAVNRFPNGSTTTQTETCRFRELQQDAQMLNG